MYIPRPLGITFAATTSSPRALAEELLASWSIAFRGNRSIDG
jgi:hypothetical protein